MRGIFLIFLSVVTSLSSCKVEKHEVFLEAESFSEKGGWVVDPQFVFQMGSPYLLAHGLGRPVEDAVQEADIPAPGRYHIWLRTMNWAPGEWEAPGRFRVSVDGKELGTDMGTAGGWGWQYAGAVTINDKVARLGLHDLTGFEGR